jgi:hypothetical protein
MVALKMEPSPVRGYLASEESTPMELTMTESEADELRDLLDGSLADLSEEIADTDNPGYRLGLKERRTRLQAIQSQLAIQAQRVG